MTVSNVGTFLTKILDHKRAEVARQALKVPLEQLQANIAAAPPPRAFDAALRRPGRVALIAEVKKASPSKGVLVENFDPLALARTYAENGAAAISVLTDVRFFQGSLKYLEGIRSWLETRDTRHETRDSGRCVSQVSCLPSYGLSSTWAPVTMKTTRSAMLVVRSAIRSRLCATVSKSVSRPALSGSRWRRSINSARTCF
jgi:hypothetical protein